jgi:type IV pilus assembly protein PilM
MAKKTAGVWGIDLGFCALKALRLEKGPEGITATAFDYIEHPKILTQPDADPDQLTREALEQFLSRNNITGDTIVISVPGQSGLARFVKLPPVEERKIAEIVKFEAKQQIPFPLDEVVWDFQRIGPANIMDGLAMDTEIGLFAMKKDMVHRYVQHFRDVLVECHTVQMAPLALVNYVAYDLLKKDPRPPAGTEGEEAPTDKKCVVALDIGTDNSNLVITDGEKVIWQRAVPLGGNHFTRALTKDAQKLTFAKAEHVKRNAVKSPDLRKILGALKPVLNDFVGEVQRSLGYFTNTHRDAQIQYLVGLGGGFRLPGLQKFLQEKLQLEVKKISRFDRLKGEEVCSSPQFTENLLSFAVPYGLAIQGLKQGRLQTNLLPQDVKMERIIRAKKPWAVAAAAALLVAIVGLTYGENQQQKLVSNPEIDKATKDAERIKLDRKKKEDEVESLRRDLAERKESIRRITSGLDERFNWHLLMQYINCTLPQANGDKLVDVAFDRVEVKKKYYTDDAKKAAAMLDKSRTPDPKSKSKDPGLTPTQQEFVKKHLVQLSVEGTHALYTEDVPLYFQRIFAATEVLRGMPQDEKDIVTAVAKGATLNEEQKKKVPEKAWVVEIRGYTYLDAADQFIQHTLMENLRYPEMVNPKLLPARFAKQLAARRLPAPAGVKQSDEEKQLEDAVLNQTSYMFLLVAKDVENPIPGQFQYIRHSALPGLVAAFDKDHPGAGDVVRKAGGGGENQPAPADAPGLRKKDRGMWRPIGEIASSVHGGGAGPAGFGRPGREPMFVPPMPAGDKDKKGVVAVPKQKRYEFVVLFLWKEPMGGTAIAAADAAKKEKE